MSFITTRDTLRQLIRRRRGRCRDSGRPGADEGGGQQLTGWFMVEGGRATEGEAHK